MGTKITELPAATTGSKLVITLRDIPNGIARNAADRIEAIEAALRRLLSAIPDGGECDDELGSAILDARATAAGDAR